MRDIIGHGGGKGGGSSHTHYEAPDSLHSISYARVLDLVSEGEILGLAEGLQSIYLNDTPIQNEDGSYNFQGVTVDFRTGTQDQDYIPGFPDIESETPVGVELKYGTPWVRAFNNTQLSAVRITLGVDQLYKADTNNGDVGGSIVNYAIELSTDGGAYQTVLSNAFNGKTMSAYQRTARIDLPRATTGWQVRVTRLTPNSTVVSVVDKTNIISFTEVIDAKLRYPMSAIVGIQVDAKQFQSVPTRAYDLFGRIIQVPSNYDPRTRAYVGTWDGTFKPSWSDNPAWVFRDLVLNDRYGLGHRITAAQLDKWALYKIARYCDELVPNGNGGTEPRFTCNLYLQTRKQAYAVLQDIASIFRGISYWGAGTIMASADMPSDPVYVYTAANVINGKFTRTGTKKSTRYTVALVTWNDPSDGYKPKVEYVEDVEGIARYGIQQAELTAFGCTSQGQAHRAGRWALATSRLETEGISFDVGLDGAIALPGQVVRIADPSRMGRRVGGRVRAVAGRTITLDKAPTVKAGDRLTVMLPAGTSETRTVSSVAGDAVTVDSDWSTAPRTAAVWSVDSDELSAPLFRVLSVTEKDEVTFTVTAVQHEPGKYDFVEKGTAITPRTQTALDVTRQAPPASVTLAGYTVSLADVQKLALQVSCAPVAGAVAYEGAYRRGNDNWVAIPRQPSPTMDVLDILPGTYMAKMAAVNSIGVTSVEVQSVAVEIARDGASKNANVLVQSDAPYFHTDQDGNTDPAVINIAAALIALDGPVTWKCVGGTLTNTTATTAQLAFADVPGAAAVVTASVAAFGRTYTSLPLTLKKVQDGAAGSDGLKIAIARLFQWAPATPAKPTGMSTFTWPGTNSGYNGTDDWANPAPANPGTPGWRLFSASVALQAALNATTSAVSYANAVIEDGAANGANGANGLRSRTVQVYQWAVSIPEGPSGSATLNWPDGTFGAAPAGWTLTPGAAPSLGMTLFAAPVQVEDTATAATTAFNWQSAAVIAIGYVGTNGGPGQQGASYVTAYCASSIGAGTSAPAPTKGKTSLPATGSGGLTGAVYSAAVPTLDAGHPYQMQTDGIYDPTTDYITWSIPYQSALKVATLSAITANLGNITGGSLNIGNGKFTVDASGNVTMSSFILFDPNTGKAILQAGGVVNPDFLPASVKNSEIAIGGRNLAEDSAFERRLRPWSQRTGAVSNIGIEGIVDGPKNLLFETNNGDAYVDGQGPWIPVTPGHTYVISCEYASAGAISSSSSYFYTSDGGAVHLPLYNSGGTRTRFSSAPWTCPAGITGLSPRFGIRCDAYSWMRVYNFDVQEGNKAAPWSPAPEDLRADAQAKADAAANAATSAATTYAAAQADLARINAQAYADGKVTAEEQRAINDAAAKAEAARVAAVNAAAADATAKAAVAATMADYSKVTGRPSDLSNLIMKGTVDDGSVGKWENGAAHIEDVVNAAGGFPYKKNLWTDKRDTFEYFTDFPVTAGETLYFGAWLETTLTDFTCCLGVRCDNATGGTVDYKPGAVLAGRKGWTYVEGKCVVPAGSAIAIPWVQMDNQGQPFNNQYLRFSGLWIGRHARGATVGADSSNLKTGTGRPNLLEQNTLPVDTSVFTSYFQVAGEGPFVARGADGFAVYSKNRRGTLWVHATGTPAAGTVVDIYRSDRVKIVPGQRYEFGVTLSTHRTTSRLVVAWYRADNTYITEYNGNDVTNSFWDTNSNIPATRSVLITTPHPEARSAMVFVRQAHYGDADPYTFTSEWYAAEALPGQTEPSPYAASALEARDLAESAQAGLADKLSQAAGGILKGQVTLQTSGAIVAGNASWGSAGYGGTGTVQSPYGFACVQNGVPRLAMSVSGDIFYSGELRGAYGTFNVVRVAGALVNGGFTEQYVWAPKGQGGFHLSGSGFIMGDYYNKKWFQITWDGNVYSERFRIVDGQVFMDGPTINSPNLGAKTVSGLYDSRGAEGLPANTTQVIGSYSVTMTGAVGAAIAQFSFQTDSGKVTLSVSGNSVTVYGRSGNGRCQGTLFVTMTDSNGMSATGSCYIDAGFGNGVPT